MEYVQLFSKINGELVYDGSDASKEYFPKSQSHTL